MVNSPIKIILTARMDRMSPGEKSYKSHCLIVNIALNAMTGKDYYNYKKCLTVNKTKIPGLRLQ